MIDTKLAELRERAQGYPANAAIYSPSDMLPLLDEIERLRQVIRDHWSPSQATAILEGKESANATH